MQGGPGKFAFVILIIFIIIDLYAFKGLRYFISGLGNLPRTILTIAYWMVPLIMVIMTTYIFIQSPKVTGGKEFYRFFYTFMAIMVLFYAPKLVFIIFELGNDIVTALKFAFVKTKLVNSNTPVQLLRVSGGVLAAILFVFTSYGIVYGKYHYKVNNVKLGYANLPDAFDGFKIIHITDWHIGSFYKKPERIEDAVRKINEQGADMVLFTGDLVNNLASELEEFMPALKKLNAPYGLYSVLGNHDYSDYVRWESEQAKRENLEKLKRLQREAGFRLLNNENVIISKEGQSIELVGVENWGVPPFAQYGDLGKALENSDSNSFKILMSHDPSHWDAEVLGKENIALTLSGHTHGMQFGVKTKGFKWSPVQIKYPRWGGLYEENNQKLYVSVGIGYVAFPGRVGMRPEIAVLELKKQ